MFTYQMCVKIIYVFICLSFRNIFIGRYVDMKRMWRKVYKTYTYCLKKIIKCHFSNTLLSDYLWVTATLTLVIIISLPLFFLTGFTICNLWQLSINIKSQVYSFTHFELQRHRITQNIVFGDMLFWLLHCKRSGFV